MCARLDFLKMRCSKLSVKIAPVVLKIRISNNSSRQPCFELLQLQHVYVGQH